LIYNLIKTYLLFFTGRKLHPPGIGIEATATGWHTMYIISQTVATVASIPIPGGCSLRPVKNRR